MFSVRYSYQRPNEGPSSSRSYAQGKPTMSAPTAPPMMRYARQTSAPSAVPIKIPGQPVTRKTTIQAHQGNVKVMSDVSVLRPHRSSNLQSHDRGGKR